MEVAQKKSSLLKSISENLYFLVTGGLAHLFAPWWVLAPVFGIISFFLYPNDPKRAFGQGTAAGTLLWTLYTYWLHFQNEGMLASKIGLVFQGVQPAALIALTGIIGGLLGGLGATTGSLARRMVAPGQ